MPSEYPCGQVVPVEREPCHQMVFQNEFVRVFAVEIGSQQRTRCHRHDNQYLTYIATIAEIVDARKNQPPETHLLHDGECTLSPAGLVHVVGNLGDTIFRNLVVELLPNSNELQRGRRPIRKLPDGGSLTDALIGEGAHIKPQVGDEVVPIRLCFEEERISAHSVSVNRTVLAEVFGPALIASPYGRELEVKGAGEASTKLRGFREIGWLPPGAIAVLQGGDKSAVRTVVFRVGRSEEDLFPAKKRCQEPLTNLPEH